MVSVSEYILPLFSFIFFLIFLYKWRYYEPSKPGKRLPPSPRKLPLIGNLHQLGAYPHRSLQSLSKRFGPLMLLHFGKVPVLVASSAGAAREILKNQDLIFSNRPKLSVADKLVYGSKDVVFAPYGDHWRQMRSICVIQLLSTKRVQSFRHVREEETSIMIEKIRQQGSLSPAINLSDVLLCLTNDIVCRIVLGRKYGQFEELVRQITEVVGTSNIGDCIPWLAWINRINGLEAKVERVLKQFDEFLEGVMKEHREQEKKGTILGEAVQSDFVDILLEYQRENKATSPIEDDAIKALLMDMFVAGIDTTQSVLDWTVAELLKHPKIMAKLKNEVRDVAATKEEITEDDLEEMHYLKAVIKEGLRLHAPVPLLVPRESNKNTKVMGYDVAAGTQVFINAWAIGKDPSLWENPEEFYPDRFFETSVDFRGLHFELIPFGAGRRGCPGVAFAMAVDELVLAKLMHKFDIKLPNGMKEEDLDMSEGTALTVHKKVPLLAVATPRIIME